MGQSSTTSNPVAYPAAGAISVPVAAAGGRDVREPISARGPVANEKTVAPPDT